MAVVDQLSPRHRDCLRLAHARLTTKEIARTLGIAPGTAASYCSEAIAILGAADRRAAAQLLFDHETCMGEGPPSEWVGDKPTVQPVPLSPGRPSHSLGPLSPANRDADNDASITSRIAWIVALAVAIALGFGSIVSSVHTVSSIVRAERGGR